MGKMKENPRYNVITFRVSDDEFDYIAEEAKASKMSIGEWLRWRLFV